MPALKYDTIQLAFQEVDFDKVAQYLLVLMLRNFSSTGYSFTDPSDPSVKSAPGCIIASPSFHVTEADGQTVEDDPNVTQDYVYNWTRDAAASIMEVAAAQWDFLPGVGASVYDDYVSFALRCQQNNHLNRAAYRIDGALRDWSDQNDGPALQTLAVIAIWPKLSAAGRANGLTVANANVQWLLQNDNYQTICHSPWEEREGECFFALAAILKCLRAVQNNGVGITVPAGTDVAVAWLEDHLAAHWSAPDSCYVSIGTGFTKGDYDPNIDVVLAAIYGAVDPTDEKLLSSVGKLRAVWAVPAEAGAPVPDSVYGVNKADWPSGRGPLLGRYPSDTYDGDRDSSVGHPWSLSTSAVAEIYYRVAASVQAAGSVGITALTADFFAQIGIDASTSPEDAVATLCTAGDQMLGAILYHSDHLELSEQFDAWTGYEKSVQNLTWSYASFLSALRARTACG